VLAMVVLWLIHHLVSPVAERMQDDTRHRADD